MQHVADAVAAHARLELGDAGVDRLGIGVGAAQHDVHVGVETTQAFGDVADFLPRQIEGRRDADQRRPLVGGIGLDEPVPLRIEVVDHPDAEAELREIVQQVDAGHRRQVPDVEQPAPLGIVGVVEEFSVTLMIEVVEVRPEAALMMDHARIDQRLVEIDAVERQPPVAIVVEHVRLCHQNEIEISHRP